MTARARKGAKGKPRGPKTPRGRVQGSLATEGVLVSSLVPDPNNARQHTDRDLKGLADSLTRFGQRKPVVVQRGTRIILAGNGLAAAAKSLGWKRIAVHWVDDDAETARRYALVDNRSAELSRWDFEALSAQLKAIHEADPGAVLMLGWDESEASPLIAADWSPQPKGDLPAGSTKGNPIHITLDQREVFERAARAVRASEGDDQIPEGRVVELIAADYLSGAEEPQE